MFHKRILKKNLKSKINFRLWFLLTTTRKRRHEALRSWWNKGMEAEERMKRKERSHKSDKKILSHIKNIQNVFLYFFIIFSVHNNFLFDSNIPSMEEMKNFPSAWSSSHNLHNDHQFLPFAFPSSRFIWGMMILNEKGEKATRRIFYLFRNFIDGIESKLEAIGSRSEPSIISQWC